MKNFIYLRGLRHAEHTVFCVQDGQKFYYDPQFGSKCAFSSGQQVKRSILDSILDSLNEQQAPITFNYLIDKNALNIKEPWSPCDPTFTDQLLGGWMKAQTGSTAVKRRSPFSISALRPLHPLLGGLEYQKENLTFDRSSNPNIHPVIVKNSKGEVLTEEQIVEFLQDNNRTLPRRSWIPDQTRATGLFIYDIAIDLRTLFSISTNQHEPELTTEKIEMLKSEGWIENKNVFGSCLTLSKDKRDKIIDAIARGLINWRITSNQARTFSLMETLALAVSYNANSIASSIRAELSEDDKRKAIPVLTKMPDADLYVALTCNGYINDANGTIDALYSAEAKIKEMLSSYDYENNN